MGFTDILHWNLVPAAAGAEALRARADYLAQHGSTVLGAPGFATWTGPASEQARALAAAHAGHSEQIAAQAASLIAPLSDYAAAGAALRSEAESLAAHAASHGFEIQPDGSVRPTRPQSGLYAKRVAEQLANKAAQLIERDEQLQSSFASAVRSARGAVGSAAQS
jgi:hypothetical protein